MPILSKKPLKKATMKPFKPPVQAKEKIDKILGIGSLSQKEKASEAIDNGLNDSVSSTSTGISSRLNEPAIKKMYMDFTVNMSKQMICSTPVPSSQNVKDEDLLNMSFKDHMLNVMKNSQDDPIGIVFDEEHKKDNCEPAISLSQEMLNRKEVKQAYMELMQNDKEDFDFMKNFKKTKTIRKIFSSFDMNEKNEQKKKTDDKPTKSKKSKKMPVENVKGVDKSKVKKAEQLKEVARNKEPKPDEATSSQKQRKPRVRKEKTPKDKKEATNSSKKLETEKGKPSNEPLVKNKPKAAIDRDSGVCSEGSNLQQLSSETDDDVQVVTNHRKLHTRALSTSSEESNISSKFRVSEEQTLACGNSLYDLGTVVWAKIEGYPWWPAMVDDDPDFGTHIWVEENFKEPTWYHVTFFDTQVVTRAWVRPDHISAYNMPIVAANKCQKMFAARLKGSIKQAENAIEMSWSGRVAKYGFVVRYPNGVGDLKKQREEKRKQEKIAETKRQRQKEKYMELIKKQVAKSNKRDVEKKKKKNLLRLYSSEVGKELQNCVDSMFDMKGKGKAINEITRMLTTENQSVNVTSDSKENINDTSIDILQMENENDHVPINCY